MPRALESRASFALVALAVCWSACSSPEVKPDEATGDAHTAPRPTGPVPVKIIAFNDLHGHMEGPSGKVKVRGERVEAGGLDAFATHVDALRQKNPNSVLVCAGDLIGASPLISALFHDEPTIEAMNAIGLDIVAVGNHEFDEGVGELRRLQTGGCHPEDGCVGKDEYVGAKFPFLAANVKVKETGETLFPGYIVREFEGVRIAFIGLTLENTPDSVSADAIEDVTFLDEAEVINTVTKELQEREGIEAFVVIVHEGGYPEAKIDDVNDCPGLSGPIVEIEKALDPAVDVIVTGHTHKAYNCTINGRLVTSAKSYGRVLTEIDLTLDPSSGDVISKIARNVPVTRDVTLNEQMVDHIEVYKRRVGPLATREVGRVSADLVRTVDDVGNSPLGQIIADAQLAATRPADKGSAEVAFMNLGGVRNNLSFAPSGEEGEGIVTYEELHSVQPFGNTMVTMTLSGAQLFELLESQWQGEGRVRMLQPSAGFEYAYDASKPIGERIVPGSVTLGGAPLEPERAYRVTVNSFLSTGGDGFKVLPKGTDLVRGPVDLDVFVDYLERNSPLSAAAPRISKAE